MLILFHINLTLTLYLILVGSPHHTGIPTLSFINYSPDELLSHYNHALLHIPAPAHTLVLIHTLGLPANLNRLGHKNTAHPQDLTFIYYLLHSCSVLCFEYTTLLVLGFTVFIILVR